MHTVAMLVDDDRTPPLLVAADEDLHSAFAHAPLGIAVLTTTGTVTGANAALGRILDRELTTLVGGTLFPFTHPDDVAGARASGRRLLAQREPVVRFECRFLRPDPHAGVVWVRVTTSKVAGDATREPHLIMHVEAISEQKALEERLAHLAFHDPLTGLGNRRLLTERAAQDLAAPTVLGLVVLDLDQFKAINDQLGHTGGDAVLVECARRLQGAAGAADLVVRLGGDEFAVWCPGTSAAAMTLLAERVRTTMATAFRVDDVALGVTVSVGWATRAAGEVAGPSPLPDLLRAADLAMYEAKRCAARPAATSAPAGTPDREGPT